MSFSNVWPTINPSFYMYLTIVCLTYGMCFTVNPSIKNILSLVDICINAAYSNLECCDLSNLVCPTIDYVSIPNIYELRIYFK